MKKEIKKIENWILFHAELSNKMKIEIIYSTVRKNYYYLKKKIVIGLRKNWRIHLWLCFSALKRKYLKVI